MIVICKHIQMPENLGAIARVMKNFGLSQLRLIQPLCRVDADQAYANAAGADDILNNMHIYDSLQEASHDLTFMVGTCGDVRQGARIYHTPHSLFNDRHASAAHETWGLLCGCERTGLTQEDLSLCNATVRIPTHFEFSSMNISHAVAVMAYAYRCAYPLGGESETHMAPCTTMATSPKATYAHKHNFFTLLMGELDDVGYWRVPSKKDKMQENLANLFFRYDLTVQEIQTLFGIVKSLRSKS